MWKKIFTVGLILGSVIYCSTGISQINKNKYVKGEILVKFKKDISVTSNSKVHPVKNVELGEKVGSLDVRIIKLPSKISVEKAVELYNNKAEVEYAEPNYVYSVCKYPDDAYFDEQWPLYNTGQKVPPGEENGVNGTVDADIDANGTWELNTGSSDVVVAIIDTGIKLDHEDLKGNLWENSDEIKNNNIDDDGNGYIDDYYGYDFVNDDGDPEDVINPDEEKSGHGTHVAGIVGAVGDNSIGIAGVCWDVSLMALKALNTAGVGTVEDIVNAVDYAKNNGADIVNCSFAGSKNTSVSRTLKDAIEQASTILFVCAAGNNGDGTQTSGWNMDESGHKRYPACYDLDNIIAVASTNQDDILASYSNYGFETVDVGAPGGNGDVSNILSTYNKYSASYAYWSGTSMAAPQVSGLAALMLARNSELSYLDVKGKIVQGTEYLSSLEGKVGSEGRINAYNSLSLVSGEGDNTDSGDNGTTDTSGEEVKFHEFCFLATAVYGDNGSFEVKKLCEFRDNYLLTNKFGKKLVKWYYEIGPELAAFAKKHPRIKKGIKWCLDKFIVIYTFLENIES